MGDASSFGFTSPISGSRYRIEVTPTFGTLNYQTLLLDYRKYLFMKPFTLAVRGMHYGLYGKDAESDRLGAMYVGDGSLVRGYSYDSFNANDCIVEWDVAGSRAARARSSTASSGSRLALANAELRIPLFGTSGFGLIASPLPPIEIAPFVDAGVAWTKYERSGVGLRVDVRRSDAGGEHRHRVADQPVRVRGVRGRTTRIRSSGRAERRVGIRAAAGLVVMSARSCCITSRHAYGYDHRMTQTRSLLTIIALHWC